MQTPDHETGFMQLLGSLNGPLLKDEDVTREFAIVLLKRLFGEAAHEFLPLSVSDEGKSWLIESAHSGEPFIPNGAQGWYMRARKTDCMVQEFGFLAPDYPDEVKDAVMRALRKGEDEGNG